KSRRQHNDSSKPSPCQRGRSTVADDDVAICGWAGIGSVISVKLLDHLVGGSEHRWRHRDAERLCRFEADNKFKLGWLFDGKVSRLGAAQNLVDIVTRAAAHLP